MIEKKLKHMEFVENVINRMNANSFAIKGWGITVVAALFALAARDTNYKFALIAYFALLVFWVLDAYYLSQEKMYRELFDAVVKKPDSDPVDFDMDARPYHKGENRWFIVMGSKTILPFYLVLIIVSLGVMYIILKPAC